MKNLNRRVVAEFKRLNRQWRLASTVDAGVAAIIILVLFKGRAGVLVGQGKFRMNVLIVNLASHCMGTFVHTINRDSQHDYEEKSGKEF